MAPLTTFIICPMASLRASDSCFSASACSGVFTGLVVPTLVVPVPVVVVPIPLQGDFRGFTPSPGLPCEGEGEDPGATTCDSNPAAKPEMLKLKSEMSAAARKERMF